MLFGILYIYIIIRKEFGYIVIFNKSIKWNVHLKDSKVKNNISLLIKLSTDQLNNYFYNLAI